MNERLPSGLAVLCLLGQLLSLRHRQGRSQAGEGFCRPSSLSGCLSRRAVSSSVRTGNCSICARYARTDTPSLSSTNSFPTPVRGQRTYRSRKPPAFSRCPGHNRGRPRRGSHSIELRLASAAFVASNDSACSPIALPTSVDESPSGVGQQPFVDWVTSSKLRSRDRVDKPPRENSSCHPRVPRPAVASDGEEAGTALHTILDITDRWAHGNYPAARPSHVPRTTDGFVETATDVRALSNQERRD